MPSSLQDCRSNISSRPAVMPSDTLRRRILHFNASNSPEWPQETCKAGIRADQIDLLRRDIEDGNSILIRGAWGSGKTTMALSLAGIDDTHAIRIDLTRYFQDRDREITGARAFIDRLGMQEIPAFLERSGYGNSQVRSGESALDHLNRLAADSSSRFLLVLDEAVTLCEEHDLLNTLPELEKYENLDLVVIAHYVRKYDKLISETFKGFKEHVPNALSRKDLRKLLNLYIRKLPIDVDEEAVELMYRLSGGRPTELQSIFSHLISENESSLLESHLCITPDDLNEACATEEDMRSFAEGSGIMLDYSQTFRYSLNSREKALLREAARKGRVAADEESLHNARRLIKLSYMKVDQKTGLLKVNGRILRSFLRQAG